MTETATGACRMCQGADDRVTTPLQFMLPSGISRFIARTPRFVAMPTFGCFVPGYILVVPHAHVLSFGQLSEQSLAEAGELVDRLCARLTGYAITRLAGLPGGAGSSYIAVRAQSGRITVYPVPNEADQRIRLRRVVAGLDPRVDPGAWDFEDARFPDLIRRTVRDLAAASMEGSL